jgi:hypothetical protein
MLDSHVGFLNNVTFNNHPDSPTLLNMWSIKNNLAGDNLVYQIEEPQFIQLVVQGKVNFEVFCTLP